jgi:hypothetical protein
MCCQKVNARSTPEFHRRGRPVAEQLDLRQTLSYDEVREILASDRK